MTQFGWFWCLRRSRHPSHSKYGVIAQVLTMRKLVIYINRQQARLMIPSVGNVLTLAPTWPRTCDAHTLHAHTPRAHMTVVLVCLLALVCFYLCSTGVYTLTLYGCRGGCNLL